ncbi:MAG: DNA/RNA non-specific endonuclease [Hymenobacteraceae bacterium]|nr:DNA/RNA non-specific endonuclease [Hymenobacteraceae bacterium]MDX5396019.1 DNA/RNA non-specific endonuclease [Hymenobacteraceae bacterium]MDX5512080.1 DNA/RNA non-specific endonuclease [Hymenobacteraceae bacterium]
MRKNLYKLLFVAVFGTFFASCQQEEQVKPGDEIALKKPTETNNNTTDPPQSTLQMAAGFPEDFESGSKGSYAIGSVTLSSGSWTLDDALIGTLSGDAKNGLKSVRIRNTGIVTMDFSSLNGAGTVSVKHAKYGTDGNSTWELWVSNNGGAFVKVGSTITTSSTTLELATFPVNLTGAVRFEIRKLSGGTNRINIDDFLFDEYTTGGSDTDTTSTTNPGGGTSAPTDHTHMAMGNPSGATTNTADYMNYLMEKPQYALSYHRDRAIPNWVSWHVNSSWLGSAPRQDDFRSDLTLPTGWYRVTSTSYTGSGFDRGHNCPSADRTSTVTDNSATFLMTNMIPQAPTNNQQTWANLENYTRTLVNAGNEVYVIMGCYGNGGTGSNGYATTINNGNIAVPNRIWKVLVVLPNGNNDVARVSTGTRVIAIDTPNSNSISTSWGSYRTSVDAIEAVTGYDLLSNVPASIQAVIEAQIDNGPTN